MSGMDNKTQLSKIPTPDQAEETAHKTQIDEVQAMTLGLLATVSHELADKTLQKATELYSNNVNQLMKKYDRLTAKVVNYAEGYSEGHEVTYQLSKVMDEINNSVSELTLSSIPLVDYIQAGGLKGTSTNEKFFQVRELTQESTESAKNYNEIYENLNRIGAIARKIKA